MNIARPQYFWHLKYLLYPKVTPNFLVQLTAQLSGFRPSGPGWAGWADVRSGVLIRRRFAVGCLAFHLYAIPFFLFRLTQAPSQVKLVFCRPQSQIRSPFCRSAEPIKRRQGRRRFIACRNWRICSERSERKMRPSLRHC